MLVEKISGNYCMGRNFLEKNDHISDEEALILAKLVATDEHLEGLRLVLLDLINIQIYSDPQSFDELDERMEEILDNQENMY